MNHGTRHFTLPAILLLYHRPLGIDDAETVSEHIHSFKQYSKYHVLAVNTAVGFPKVLRLTRFSVIVLHYSLFGYPYEQYLDRFYFRYLKKANGAHKIAFFQDEHHFCQPRFNFLNEYNIDCVFTLVEPDNYQKTYGKYTKVKKLVYNIPGYVSEGMVRKAAYYESLGIEKNIDVSYRGRNLLYYMGRGSQEKFTIGKEFLERARNTDLNLDIGIEESDRIYGEAWYKFLALSRACLGVEAGVSIFDLEDEVRRRYDAYISDHPEAGFDEVSEDFLHEYEDNVYYRTISPRHFEAAAFRVCQILFEGKYSGILKPMVHYIPLKKDFSNFDEVVDLFRNDAFREALVERAYNDLIESPQYNYESFVGLFDDELAKEGLMLEERARGCNSRQKELADRFKLFGIFEFLVKMETVLKRVVLNVLPHYIQFKVKIVLIRNYLLRVRQALYSIRAVPNRFLHSRVFSGIKSFLSTLIQKSRIKRAIKKMLSALGYERLR